MNSLPEQLTNEISTTLEILEDNIELFFNKKIVDSYHFLKENSDGATAIKKISKLTKDERLSLARIFSCKMELINRIENSYRHYRISSKERAPIKKLPYATIFVFTAHPTEARSSATIFYFEKFEELFRARFLNQISNHDFRAEVNSLLAHILRNRLSKTDSPTVKDEVKLLCQIVLSQNILNSQAKFMSEGKSLFFRTWVGGDKDGHPHVNEKTLKDTFSISRGYILDFIFKHLEEENQFWLMDKRKSGQRISDHINFIIKELKKLKILTKNDGDRVIKVKELISKLEKDIKKENVQVSRHVEHVLNIIWLYPALVLQVELREDAALVKEALLSGKGTIKKMLEYVKEVSGKYNPKWYARGFVLSMTETSEDLLCGIDLVRQVFNNKYPIPVVPLFETKKALLEGTQILKEAFDKDKFILKHHKNVVEGRFEIMLGYSDSSKESGVLASRTLIANVLTNYEKFFKAHGLTPVFFHGAGGSVERGGGSISDQTSWWPKSALNIYKSTVQGEMITRNFSDSLIMESMTHKILENFEKRVTHKDSKKDFDFIKSFSLSVANKYQELVKNEDFIKLVIKGTPYSYLDELKIGSRPSSRNKNKNEFKLRAIPWVLCFTQTRVLLPTWWGIGQSFHDLSSEEKLQLLKIYRRSPFLQTFVNVLGFTLKKVRLGVFMSYLEELLPEDDFIKWKEIFISELERTIEFFKFLTGEENFIWFRPWLEESIDLRSPKIDPLNFLQIYALKNKEVELLRETVTGVACGMLTTG